MNRRRGAVTHSLHPSRTTYAGSITHRFTLQLVQRAPGVLRLVQLKRVAPPLQRPQGRQRMSMMVQHAQQSKYREAATSAGAEGEDWEILCPTAA